MNQMNRPRKIDLARFPEAVTEMDGRVFDRAGDGCLGFLRRILTRQRPSSGGPAGVPPDRLLDGSSLALTYCGDGLLRPCAVKFSFRADGGPPF